MILNVMVNWAELGWVCAKNIFFHNILLLVVMWLGSVLCLSAFFLEAFVHCLKYSKKWLCNLAILDTQHLQAVFWMRGVDFDFHSTRKTSSFSCECSESQSKLTGLLNIIKDEQNRGRYIKDKTRSKIIARHHKIPLTDAASYVRGVIML